MAVRELEEHYGVRLFDRIGRRLYLTQAGKEFLRYTDRILALCDELETGARQWGDRSPLHIGSSMTIGTKLLPGPGYEHGFFYNLVESSQQVGERPTAAFPSSHVGMSTILMIMAWRGSRRLFACLLSFYLLLCGATVYIQAHYLIDAIVGFFSAIVLYVVATWMFKRWFAQPMFK